MAAFLHSRGQAQNTETPPAKFASHSLIVNFDCEPAGAFSVGTAAFARKINVRSAE